MSGTRRRASLASRITALCLAVAGVAVLVAGLVSAGLVRSAAEDVLHRSLVAQADVVAGQAEETGLGSRLGLGRVAQVLRGQGISIVVRGPRGRLSGDDERAVRAAAEAGLREIAAGGSASATQVVDGQEFLVELRGLESRETAFALVEPVRTARDTQRGLVRNILLALGVGLLLAAGAGLLLARVLARPLRHVAEVAGAMRQGRRDLRVPVEGPAEVAEVARAVNELADALRYSESRQREFLLSVSHELRTPLTAVRGFAESLADGVSTGEDARRAGEVIQQEAQRLERLVTDLLELARLGADEFRLDLAEVDLADLVRHGAEVWRERCARQGARFVLQEPGTPVVCRVDPRRLRQVLDALADNALRVLPEGAPLVVSLTRAEGGAAVLQVRDGGPGLAPEDYPIAFERGALHARYRGKRPVGSGVGLALAHALVTRMGGTIQAGPAPEGGAAFTITLPTVPTPTGR